MDDIYMNNTSQNRSFNFTESMDNDFAEVIFIMYVVDCIIICIGLPLTLLAIYALYSLVKHDHVAPIYVINLLITDIIQLCCLIAEVTQRKRLTGIYFTFTRFYFLMASVCFMVCIALERYLVIACPLWYRLRRTIKISVVVCIIVWVLPVVLYFLIFLSNTEIMAGILLLLPLPLLIFCLGGTLKALSASISVHSDEKRRIVAMLVLVLLIYVLLFLPAIIVLLFESDRPNFILIHLSLEFVKLNPLADLVLYILMRKGTIDKLLASVCCCRMDDNDISSSEGGGGTDRDMHVNMNDRDRTDSVIDRCSFQKDT